MVVAAEEPRVFLLHTAAEVIIIGTHLPARARTTQHALRHLPVVEPTPTGIMQGAHVFQTRVQHLIVHPLHTAAVPTTTGIQAVVLVNKVRVHRHVAHPQAVVELITIGIHTPVVANPQTQLAIRHPPGAAQTTTGTPIIVLAGPQQPIQPITVLLLPMAVDITIIGTNTHVHVNTTHPLVFPLLVVAEQINTLIIMIAIARTTHQVVQAVFNLLRVAAITIIGIPPPAIASLIRISLPVLLRLADVQQILTGTHTPARANHHIPIISKKTSTGLHMNRKNGLLVSGLFLPRTNLKDSGSSYPQPPQSKRKFTNLEIKQSHAGVQLTLKHKMYHSPPANQNCRMNTKAVLSKL